MIPIDSVGLVDHFLSYLCRLNADSLSFIYHQKADVCMGVERRPLGRSGVFFGGWDKKQGLIVSPHIEVPSSIIFSCRASFGKSVFDHLKSI